MCSDMAWAPGPIEPKPRTPGEALDAALAKKERENAALRKRVEAIEAECQRLRRETREW